MRLTFNKQPLKQVALRFSFGEYFEITPEFLVDLAKELEPRLISRSDMIDNPPGVTVSGLQPLTTPTLFAFKISAENGVNSYFQEDMLSVRWRGVDSTSYPHFEALLSEAACLLSKTKDITKTVPIVKVCNLFYQNTFNLDENEDIRSYVNNVYLPDSIEGDLVEHNYSWRTADCDVRLHIRTGIFDGSPIIDLQTSAGLIINEMPVQVSTIAEKSKILNVTLNQLFLKIITSGAKSKWQLAQ